MKVIIDTNILISGAYDENSAAWKIIRAVIDGSIEAFATHKTMKENRALLNRTVMDKNYKQLLEEYFRRLKIVGPAGRMDVVSDPEDNKLFESAVAANADYLITNDKEVLYVGQFEGTKVVTPEEFCAKYQEDIDDNSVWQDWTNLIMGQ